MPLVRGIDHGIPLVQQPVLAVCHGVQTALVHIGEFRHGMGFPGEQKALLLLLIEKGIDSRHTQLAVNAHTVHHIRAHLLRLDLRGEHDGSLGFIDIQREEKPLPQRNGLVQVIMLIVLTILADRQDAHIAGTAQKRIGPCPEDGGLRLGKLDLNGIPGRGLIDLCSLWKDRAKPLKIHLIQVLNHSAYAPFVYTITLGRKTALQRTSRQNRCAFVPTSARILYKIELKMANDYSPNFTPSFRKKCPCQIFSMDIVYSAQSSSGWAGVMAAPYFAKTGSANTDHSSIRQAGAAKTQMG